MFINSSFFLIIWIISSFAKDLSDRDVQSIKQASLRFQEMQERKDLIFLEYGDFFKRAQIGYQDTRGKKNSFKNYVDYYMNIIDFDKRALMCFQGMKRKKHSDKKTPMRFQAMKGKRNTERRCGIRTVFETRSSDYQGMDDKRNNLAWCQVEKRLPFRCFETHKKKNPQWESPRTFVGVRGKKWATSSLYEDSNPFITVFDNIKRISMDRSSSAILGCIRLKSEMPAVAITNVAREKKTQQILCLRSSTVRS